MNKVPRRPFYSEYAWAFDLLIDRPVRKECAVIAAWLIDRGIRPGMEILDAGCGTGRYAIELARRGYVVNGVDLSPDLIEVARGARAESTGRVSFRVGDIAHLPNRQYAAILCRGVLNDVVEDSGRDAIFTAFAEALTSNGVLMLDVREWGASLERKIREPLFRKRVSTDRGELTFTSITALDPEKRQLLISERHELIDQGRERISDYHFVMRCWVREELDVLLARNGFGKVSYFGAYDPGIAAGATDRVVVVAQQCGAGRPKLAADAG
jgi:SAM-dependent methyltransferase